MADTEEKQSVKGSLAGDVAEEQSSKEAGTNDQQSTDDNSAPSKIDIEAEKQDAPKDEVAPEDNVTGEETEKQDGQEKEEIEQVPTADEEKEPTPANADRENEVSERVIVTEMESGDLLYKLNEAIENLNREHGRLKSSQLSDYQYASEFKYSLQETIEILDTSKQQQVKKQTAIHDLRQALEAICQTLREKLEKENDATIDREATGRLKEALRLAAEAEEETAKTAQQAAEAIAKAEQDVVAIDAILEARESKQQKDKGENEDDDDEETKLRKAEERQREDEARQEAERLKKEEEERKRIEREEQRKRKEEEERLRREEDAKYDPKSWPIFDYKCDDNSEFDGIVCIVRVPPGTFQKKELTCTKMSLYDLNVPLEDDEELVSGLIRVEPSEELKSEEPWAIAVPHNAPKGISYRETVVKVELQNGTWRDMTTREATIPEFRDLKLAEVRTRRTWTMAVITRPKKDTFTIKKPGGTFTSSVDSRFQLTFENDCFDSYPQTLTLNVTPFESSVVQAAKQLRNPDGSMGVCDRLIVASAVVRLGLPSQKFLKPVSLTMTLAQNPLKHQQQASEKPKAKITPITDSDSPKKSYGIGMLWKDDDEEDMVHLLTREETGHWTISTDLAVKDLGAKDMVEIILKKPFGRILLLRTKMHSKPDDVEKMAATLERLQAQRSAVVVLRQNHDSPKTAKILCVSKSKLEKTLEELASEGYTEGPKPSKEHICDEGQIITFGFRGNVTSDKEDVDTRLMFNCQMKSSVDLSVTEVDKFANKCFHDYHGFIQLYTDVKVKKLVDTGQGRRYEMVPEKTLISELEINIPKPEKQEQKRNLTSIPIIPNGIINEELFREIASEMNYDDSLRLASFFELSTSQIQIIKRDFCNQDEEMAYCVLATWWKAEKRQLDKGDTLYRALASAGRREVAEMVRERDLKFKEEREKETREKRMEKACARVSQNSEVLGKWKLFATKGLGFSESEVEEIDAANENNRLKLLDACKRWGSKEESDTDHLIRHLQRLKFRQAADEVKLVA
ncbi:death domain-containing protein 1-like isoform X2 [Tubulanus polymorphus]|uniref:death domain-containing protein 1-like isoform X2 n=1 Tax=Tubulanus polymorphus TaxID=672921 RepID=UPI003DA63DC5